MIYIVNISVVNIKPRSIIKYTALTLARGFACVEVVLYPTSSTLDEIGIASLKKRCPLGFYLHCSHSLQNIYNIGISTFHMNPDPVKLSIIIGHIHFCSVPGTNLRHVMYKTNC